MLHSPQLSSNPYNTFAMSAASSIPSAVTESFGQEGAEPQVTQLRCTFPDCSQDRDFFTESSLRYFGSFLINLPTYKYFTHNV